jgi:radical SAM protein with 4Fe4S-binding SPASM domain
MRQIVSGGGYLWGVTCTIKFPGSNRLPRVVRKACVTSTILAPRLHTTFEKTAGSVRRVSCMRSSFMVALRNITRLGKQVALSYLGYSAPLEVGWDVTYRCNAHCSYCTNWTTDYPNMPLDKVAVLVDRVRRLGTFQMSLSGGEPLMRKDIVEIVELIKGAGMRCSLVTNGSISREPLFRALMEAGIDTIAFSIDGATKETHERFRQGTSFERLIRSIETCVRLTREHGYATRLSTNTVLTNANVQEIPRIAELIRSLGLKDFKFQPVWRQHYTREHLGHSTDGQQGANGDPKRSLPIADSEGRVSFNDYFGFTRENEALLTEAVAAIRDVGSANDSDFTTLIPDFYLHTPRAKAVQCFAGRAFLFIDADGNVCPCGKVEKRFGNILDDEWEEDPSAMFETPAARSLKREVACQSCGGCTAVAYMERNLLLASVTHPARLGRVVARRVLR